MNSTTTTKQHDVSEYKLHKLDENDPRTLKDFNWDPAEVAIVAIPPEVLEQHPWLGFVIRDLWTALRNRGVNVFGRPVLGDIVVGALLDAASSLHNVANLAPKDEQEVYDLTRPRGLDELLEMLAGEAA